MDGRAEYRRILATVKRHAGQRRDLGVPLPRGSAPKRARPSVQKPIEQPEQQTTMASNAAGQSLLDLSKPNPYAEFDHEALRVEASACVRCPLHKTRTNVVFGVGNENADLMFIGEAPGHDEDLQGIPFVGRAGQLLTKIIEAMGLAREDVYIANVLKCRPPENRNPLPKEVSQCQPFLLRQVDIVRPKAVVALGGFAVQTLLNTQERISRLRGRFHDANGIRVMPTYHPAYLLRNPSAKRMVWEDIQVVIRELGLPIKDE